ncbi:hypothetical protein [Demequina litorisediminis]|uniref:Uncharacterized protein n=1 Tax=Demequina litorisediminis TaxID=1849022 RepID=A0ABQ6IEA1_9MICO|nr:hypothetical protein [Demequina litorisediminis]GMA35428.1 hypothetical protein GCM10025876_16320 [Demequina litorisediminis]
MHERGLSTRQLWWTMRPEGWWRAAIMAVGCLSVAWLIVLFVTLDSPPPWLQDLVKPLVMLTGAVIVAWLAASWREAKRRTTSS